MNSVPADTEKKDVPTKEQLVLRLMQLIYGAWIFTAPPGEERVGLPHAEGPLAYALREMASGGRMPPWAARLLHFSLFDTGLVCLEMEPVRGIALECGVIYYQAPTYTRSIVQVSSGWASFAMGRLQMPEEDFRNFGRDLRATLGKFEEQFKERPRT